MDDRISILCFFLCVHIFYFFPLRLHSNLVKQQRAGLTSRWNCSGTHSAARFQVVCVTCTSRPSLRLSVDLHAGQALPSSSWWPGPVGGRAPCVWGGPVRQRCFVLCPTLLLLVLGAPHQRRGLRVSPRSALPSGGVWSLPSDSRWGPTDDWNDYCER